MLHQHVQWIVILPHTAKYSRGRLLGLNSSCEVEKGASPRNIGCEVIGKLHHAVNAQKFYSKIGIILVYIMPLWSSQLEHKNFNV